MEEKREYSNGKWKAQTINGLLTVKNNRKSTTSPLTRDERIGYLVKRCVISLKL